MNTPALPPPPNALSHALGLRLYLPPPPPAREQPVRLHLSARDGACSPTSKTVRPPRRVRGDK